MMNTAHVAEAPPASRLDRRKARTRQALIDAAARLIAEGRGEGATIEEITDKRRHWIRRVVIQTNSPASRPPPGRRGIAAADPPTATLACLADYSSCRVSKESTVNAVSCADLPTAQICPAIA